MNYLQICYGSSGSGGGAGDGSAGSASGGDPAAAAAAHGLAAADSAAGTVGFSGVATGVGIGPGGASGTFGFGDAPGPTGYGTTQGVGNTSGIGGYGGGYGNSGFGSVGGLGGAAGAGYGSPSAGFGSPSGGGHGGPTGISPAIMNALIQAAQMGLGQQGVLSGLGNAAPVGAITHSPLSPPEDLLALPQYGSQRGPLGNMGNPVFGPSQAEAQSAPSPSLTPAQIQALLNPYGNAATTAAPYGMLGMGQAANPFGGPSTASPYGSQRGVYGNVGNPAFGQSSQASANQANMPSPNASPMSAAGFPSGLGSVTSATPALAALFGHPASPALQGVGGQPATFQGGRRVV